MVPGSVFVSATSRDRFFFREENFGSRDPVFVSAISIFGSRIRSATSIVGSGIRLRLRDDYFSFRDPLFVSEITIFGSAIRFLYPR